MLAYSANWIQISRGHSRVSSSSFFDVLDAVLILVQVVTEDVEDLHASSFGIKHDSRLVATRK